jgi:hypothetical protein
MSSHRAQSAALLAGVTILSAVSGTEVRAATTTPQTFSFFTDTYSFFSDTLSFDPFNTGLGTLTGVSFDISGYFINREGQDATAAVKLGSTTLYQATFSNVSLQNGVVSATFDGTASGQIPLSAFEGGSVSILVEFVSNVGDFDFGGGTSSRNPLFNIDSLHPVVGDTGLSLTYTYDSTEVSSTPLPAAIWLFGSGVAGLAVVSRRRRRSA